MVRLERSISVLFVSALLLLAGGSAGAQENDESQDDNVYARPGGYFGASAIAAFPTFLEDDLEDSRSADVDPGAGFNVRVGYRTSEYFAFEVMGEWVPQFEVDSSPTERGRFNNRDIPGFDEWTSLVFTANAKIPWPLGRFEPYLTIGPGIQYVAQTDSTTNDDIKFAIRQAVGVDFYATKNWVVNAEFINLSSFGNVRGVSQVRHDYYGVGVGIAYRLDGPDF